MPASGQPPSRLASTRTEKGFSNAPQKMNLEHLLTFGTLTLVMGGTALYIAPAEKRPGFLLHIVLVTLLTLMAVTMEP
ncbi:hypothetical protein VARIO8X_90414 [Burkholderiales bacterium 8X]|nr:hypothetical protein VARIO8X_90414 [Burkholderiales bacterium 8X]